MRVKFGNATKDVPILEVTAANYIVPKGEEGAYHCRIEQKQFSPTNGQRLSRPRIQKFEPKMWPMVSRNLRMQGWDIDVLYDPTDYLRKKEEEAQMTAEERMKAQREAEERRRQAEKEAMKAEILAELKASGLIMEPEKKTKEPDKGGSKKK